IEVLAEHFVAKYAEANGVPVPILSAEARALLRRHHWRGNVRELENAMHRAVILGQDSRITAQSILLPGAALTPVDGGATPPDDDAVSAAVAQSRASVAAGARNLVGHTVADVERDLILGTLEHCLGNRTHAANILGISIRTLRNKLKQYSQDGRSIPMPREAERSSA
ncbi:MAG: helix-turn-helix domain-containing protein, partial [Kiloniellaceae bacterium]